MRTITPMLILICSLSLVTAVESQSQGRETSRLIEKINRSDLARSEKKFLVEHVTENNGKVCPPQLSARVLSSNLSIQDKRTILGRFRDVLEGGGSDSPRGIMNIHVTNPLDEEAELREMKEDLDKALGKYKGHVADQKQVKHNMMQMIDNSDSFTAAQKRHMRKRMREMDQ